MALLWQALNLGQESGKGRTPTPLEVGFCFFYGA